MGSCLIISCEHGGHKVPPAYAALFARNDTLLASHRGWDPGALQLARQFARSLGAPIYASTTTRLLVDLNRSIGHRHLFSEFTRGLGRSARQQIVARHYAPHRAAVETAVQRQIAAGTGVIHIASHSFTPVLDGVLRQADVAWLYDPRRAPEAAFARRWMVELGLRASHLRLRRNYPYQGRGDGLTALLRKRYCGASYVGIELEVNQRFMQQGGAAWSALRQAVVDSLGAALAH